MDWKPQNVFFESSISGLRTVFIGTQDCGGSVYKHYQHHTHLLFEDDNFNEHTYIDDMTGAIIDYYEVEVRSFKANIYPNLPATDMVGYDGLYPGPTFMMQKGREAVVRFSNNGPTNMSTHVHGQYNRAPFDGWAADYAYPGQYKDYYYPNAQNARTIWYHDHTEFKTGENVYMGLEGFYLLRDDEEQALGLPAGIYDIPLSLSDKQYSVNGSLVYNTNFNNGLWGDVIQVNGQPWPFLNVEPRKYRFRLLNGAVSRTFNLSLHLDSNEEALDFSVIASDCGLLSHPVTTKYLAFAMGERYEIVVDFAKHIGRKITVRNAQYTGLYPDYAATDRVMQFVVDAFVNDASNNGAIPSSLRSIPPPPQTNITKNFTFSLVNHEWVVNGVGFTDVEHRILTRPTQGSDEIWELTNGGGNATHPIHIHLVGFQVLSRTGGRNAVLPYETVGVKDIVCMFHCHNLVHEDHDMLVAFNVTQLEKWGYDNSTLFIDPMEPAFRPKTIAPEDFTESSICKKLDWFWGLDAYNQSLATRSKLV
ncbi:Nn.00g001960.m01.CDS01 [Neocucurbitaria sp. VM-36]